MTYICEKYKKDLVVSYCFVGDNCPHEQQPEPIHSHSSEDSFSIWPGLPIRERFRLRFARDQSANFCSLIR